MGRSLPVGRSTSALVSGVRVTIIGAGRRWRYYVSRAALTGRKQDAGSVVRIPASEIENRIAHAIGAHLAAHASAIDECHINPGKLYDDRGNRMSSSHASKGGRWRYYVSRAALTGRKQDAGSIVRVPASEIENRITRAVGTHLAVQAAIAIDDHHTNHSVLGANQAIPQHEQTRRLRRDPPTEDDVRNAIERATVSAKRIEIVLSEFTSSPRGRTGY